MVIATLHKMKYQSGKLHSSDEMIVEDICLHKDQSTARLASFDHFRSKHNQDEREILLGEQKAISFHLKVRLPHSL